MNNVVSLQKGQRVDLTKGTNLKKIIIGLGWQENRYTGGHDFDPDVSVFMVDEYNKTQPEDFIFYNNPKHKTGSVIHSGDDRKGGDGNSDNEQIIVEFSKIPSYVEKLAVPITIYDYVRRNQNFGMMSKVYVRVVDADTNQELLRYDLKEDYSILTALVACEIYRHGNEWKFHALGAGFDGGLAAICKDYGLDTN